MAFPSPEGSDAHGGHPQPAHQIQPKSPTSDATTTQLSPDPDAPAVDLQLHPSPIPNQPRTKEIELGLGSFLVAPVSPPAATPAPAATPLANGHQGKPISCLSPHARPFLPSGRPKLQRWTELSDSDDDVDDLTPQPPASYRDALCSGPASASTSRADPASPPAPSAVPTASPRTSPRPRPKPVAVAADALRRRAEAERRATRSRPPRRPRRPRAQLVHGLPLRAPESRRPAPPRRRDDRPLPPPLRQRGASPSESRIPVHQRLGSRPSGRDRSSRSNGVDSPPHARVGGAPTSTSPPRLSVHQRLGPVPRRRFSPPDAEGWQEVLRQQCRPGKPSPSPLRPQLPAELDGRCLNCLSYRHKVATCKLPSPHEMLALPRLPSCREKLQASPYATGGASSAPSYLPSSSRQW
ncbi:unnamed protein product [Urochloa humidicola]